MAQLRTQILENSGYDGDLYAAGDNIHKRLNERAAEDADIPGLRMVFRREPKPSTFVLFTSSFSTVIVKDERVITMGQSGTFDHTPIVHDLQISAQFRDGFGDELLWGCITRSDPDYVDDNDVAPYDDDRDGEFWRFENWEFECQGFSAMGGIGFIARTESDHMALVLKQPRGDKLCRAFEFDGQSVDGVVDDCGTIFNKWFEDPNDPEINPLTVRKLPDVNGRAKQLVANDNTFVLFMEDGTLGSWSITNGPQLGRIAETQEQANTPGWVRIPGDLPVQKVACGGDACAALCKNGELYIWDSGDVGAVNPRVDKPSSRLCWGGTPVRIQLPATHGNPPPQSLFIDVAVGEGHVVALTEEQEAWAIGDNENGQLAVKGFKEDFSANWLRVPGQKKVTRVWAGDRCTFLTKA